MSKSKIGTDQWTIARPSIHRWAIYIYKYVDRPDLYAGLLAILALFEIFVVENNKTDTSVTRIIQGSVDVEQTKSSWAIYVYFICVPTIQNFYEIFFFLYEYSSLLKIWVRNLLKYVAQQIVGKN